MMQRAIELLRQLGHQYLNAAVFRIVWGLPLWVVIAIALIIFVLLVVIG